MKDNLCISRWGAGAAVLHRSKPNMSICLILINFWQFYQVRAVSQCLLENFSLGGLLLLEVAVKGLGRLRRWICGWSFLDARWISIKRARSLLKKVLLLSTVSSLQCWRYRRHKISVHFLASLEFFRRFSARRRTHGQCWRERLQHKRGFFRW